MAGRRGYADNALDAIDTAGLSDDSKRELGALKKAYYDIRGQLSVSSQVGRRVAFDASPAVWRGTSRTGSTWWGTSGSAEARPRTSSR